MAINTAGTWSGSSYATSMQSQLEAIARVQQYRAPTRDELLTFADELSQLGIGVGMPLRNEDEYVAELEELYQKFIANDRRSLHRYRFLRPDYEVRTIVSALAHTDPHAELRAARAITGLWCGKHSGQLLLRHGAAGAWSRQAGAIPKPDILGNIIEIHEPRVDYEEIFSYRYMPDDTLLQVNYEDSNDGYWKQTPGLETYSRCNSSQFPSISIGVVSRRSGAQTWTGSGNGVLFSPCHVLTTRQALFPDGLINRDQPFQFAIEGSTGTSIAHVVEIGSSEETGNYAVLQLDACLGNLVGYAKLSPVSLDQMEQLQEAAVAIYGSGFPKDDFGYFASNNCHAAGTSSNGPDVWSHDCPASGIMSGSPLFADVDGRQWVFALMTSTDPLDLPDGTGTNVKPVHTALPVNQFYNHIKKYMEPADLGK